MGRSCCEHWTTMNAQNLVTKQLYVIRSMSPVPGGHLACRCSKSDAGLKPMLLFVILKQEKPGYSISKAYNLITSSLRSPDGHRACDPSTYNPGG